MSESAFFCDSTAPTERGRREERKDVGKDVIWMGRKETGEAAGLKKG
jgi:hypothetical protein